MCQANVEWVEALLIVLIVALRIYYKEDIRASTAEFLYGTQFQENFLMTKICQTIHSLFEGLCSKSHQRPLHIINVFNRPFVFKYLYICTYVFLRDNSAKCPLEQPYIGLHRLVESILDRVFAVRVDGKRLNISAERLKSAYFTA